MSYNIKFKKINNNELSLILNKKEWIIRLKRKWKLNINNNSNILNIKYKIFLWKKINKKTKKYNFFENWIITFIFSNNHKYDILIKEKLINELKDYIMNKKPKIQNEILSFVNTNINHFLNNLYSKIIN